MDYQEALVVVEEEMGWGYQEQGWAIGLDGGSGTVISTSGGIGSSTSGVLGISGTCNGTVESDRIGDRVFATGLHAHSGMAFFIRLDEIVNIFNLKNLKIHQYLSRAYVVIRDKRHDREFGSVGHVSTMRKCDVFFISELQILQTGGGAIRGGGTISGGERGGTSSGGLGGGLRGGFSGMGGGGIGGTGKSGPVGSGSPSGGGSDVVAVVVAVADNN
ncbi:hypothetical protein ACOSP7_007756 [Xanthoceras sorbifolium]